MMGAGRLLMRQVQLRSGPGAPAELAECGALLAARLGVAVPVMTLADDVRGALERLRAPVRVSTYLLAEGQFVTSLRQAAAGLGHVAAPLGTHPALVRLVWHRYDEAARSLEQVR